MLTRLAWFSPLPPVRSGIASDSAELLDLLDADFAIDRFDERRAHEFIWKQQRSPYDLVIYQLGNAHYHDYIWGYLAAFPGLVAVHDPRLHQARARQLLTAGRADDYRHEFRYNHPDAAADFAEYAVVGLGGPIYNFWWMLRVVMRTARMVAVHNPRIAEQLGEEFPDTPVATIHLGKSPLHTDPSARAKRRQAFGIADSSTLFAVFGKITPEKRISAILRALRALVDDGWDARLLLAGDASDWPSLGDEIAANTLTDRVHMTGHVDDRDIGGWLSAADVCLCLRWPTALETSGSWLQCLAASKPTVISDLAHLVDIPTLEPYGWRSCPGREDPVAIRIDLLDEDAGLRLALTRLADDEALRDRLGRAGYTCWKARHTMQGTADDYRRVIADALGRPAPQVSDLPAHCINDDSDHARAIAAQFGVAWDDLWELRADSSARSGRRWRAST